MKIIVVALLACAVLLMNADVTHAECAQICPAIYLPLCGKNAKGEQRTFSSDCDLNSYNCRNPDQKFDVEKKAACN